MVDISEDGKVLKESLDSLQLMNSILRQQLKVSRKVNLNLSNEIAQMRQKYQEAMDQLVDEVVRLEGVNTEAKLHFNLLWEEFQVEKLASVERRKMLTQLRKDHAEELLKVKKSMPETPISMRMGKDLVSVFEETGHTPKRKESNSSEHEEFEALLECALEITGSGYESPKLPSISISFPDLTEKDRLLLPRRGSFEQHQEDSVLRARAELFTQPPAELPFDVLANLLDEESESGKKGKSKSRRLSLTEPHRLKALAGLVNSSEAHLVDHDEGKSRDMGSDELFLKVRLPEKRDLVPSSAKSSVTAVSKNSSADNSASRLSWVQGARPRGSEVTTPNMDSHEHTETPHDQCRKEDDLSQNEVPDLEHSDDDEESTSLVCLSNVAVIPSGVLQVEERVDLLDVYPANNCSVIYPCNLNVRQQSSTGVTGIIPLLNMDSSSIVKLLREGSSLIVNVPHAIGESQNDIIDDCDSSDASDETPLTEASMRMDVPDWIRRTYEDFQDIPSLEISDPHMAFIMPRLVCLELQHVLSLTVKVKRARHRIRRDLHIEACRKRSQSAAQPNYVRIRARGRKKISSTNSREPAVSMNPIMRYNASLRASPLFIHKSHGSSNRSSKVTRPQRLKHPKGLSLVPSPSSSLGLGHSGSEFNTNHNKQKVNRRASPLAADSSNSRSRSCQRSSDNELKRSSENHGKEKTKGGRRKEKQRMVRNHKNARQYTLQQDEDNEPSAVVKKKRSTGRFFSKFR